MNPYFVILISSIATFIFGSLWYTVIFGRVWERLMGFTPEMMERAKQGSMAGKMVIMFVMNVLTASVLYYLQPMLLVLSFSEFICVTLVIWVGFNFPVLMGAYLWEGKSIRLVLLNTAYGLLSFGILSAIIYYLR